jgi:predicted porin
MNDDAATRTARRLAALLAGVAAVVSAPAAGQMATLYGQLNLTLEAIEARSPTGSQPGGVRLSSNSSRFGFRGLEPLPGGLVAIWQIESGISADAGGGALASRETYLGLDGDWGTVKAGNFLAPYDDMHAIFGNVPTLTSSILSTAAIWSQGSLSKAAGGFDARLPNSLRFDTPDWHGAQGSVQYALGEDARDSYVLGANAIYNHGPFDAGIGYEFNHDVRDAGLDDWALTATAAWNFGSFRLAGVYERLRYETPVGPLSRNFWGASATVLVGAGTFYAFYGQADDGKAPAEVRVGGLTSGPGSGATQVSVSYTHPLSPRTLLYAGFVRLANERLASYNFATNPYTAGPQTGLRLNGYVLGAAHFF